MRVSLDPWEPVPPARRSSPVPVWGPERVEAVNTEKCPKCGAEPMVMCVYVQVPMPRGYSQGGQAAARYDRSGTPTKVPHIERTEALRASKRRERQRGYREYHKAQARVQAAVRPGQELRKAVHAMRQWDLAEHERLGAWIREHGHILVNAAEEK